MAYGVGQVQQFSPQEHLAKALQLRAAQLEIDQRESETAQKLRADAEKAKDDAWLQMEAGVYKHQDGSPDWGTIRKHAVAYKPDFGLSLGERLDKASMQEAQMEEKRLANDAYKFGAIASLADQVDDEDSYQNFIKIAPQIDQEFQGPPQFDPSFIQQVREKGKLNADYTKNRLATEQAASKGLIDSDAYLGKLLSTAQSQEDVDNAFKGARTRYHLSAEQMAQLQQDWGAQFGEGFAEQAGARSMTANERQDNATSIANSQRMADAAIAAQQIASGNLGVAQGNLAVRRQEAAEGANERIVQIMGPNGTPIWVRESEAVGKPAAQAARAVTGAERGVLAYYNRAKEAVETLTKPLADGVSLEDKMAKSGALQQTGLNYLPDVALTSDQRSYRQAQRAFTEARLRKESGAAIPTAEYINDAKTYFVQPGDDARAAEQKRKARQTVLDGLKFSAGKAYEEYYGEPNQSPASAGPPPSGRFNPATGKVEPVK